MAELTGTVTISPTALIGIISRTVSDIAGASRLGTVPPLRVGQLLTGSHARDGVQVRVDGAVAVDIYLITQIDYPECHQSVAVRRAGSGEGRGSNPRNG